MYVWVVGFWFRKTGFCSRPALGIVIFMMFVSKTGMISIWSFVMRFRLTFDLLLSVEKSWSMTFSGLFIPTILNLISPSFVRISSRPKTTVPPRVFAIPLYVG